MASSPLNGRTSVVDWTASSAIVTSYDVIGARTLTRIDWTSTDSGNFALNLQRTGASGQPPSHTLEFIPADPIDVVRSPTSFTRTSPSSEDGLSRRLNSRS